MRRRSYAVRLSVKVVVGGRHWTRTSDLLHVKHFRLSAVLRAWEVERKCVSYAVTDSVATSLNWIVLSRPDLFQPALMLAVDDRGYQRASAKMCMRLIGAM